MDIAPSPATEDHELNSRARLRETINLVLPDSLMIALAVVMIPLIVIPLVWTVPHSIETSITFVDYIILAIFVAEYVSKLLLAPNILRHFIDPWHLLDLLIVVLPVVNLMPFLATRLAVSSPLLRLLRIARIAAVGGRTLDRRAQLANPSQRQEEESVHQPMRIQVMDGQLANDLDAVPLGKLKQYLDSPSHTWANISLASEPDLDGVSAVLGIPKIILESELVEESYPRVDYFDRYSMIFARIAEVEVSDKGPALLSVRRSGLLLVCHGQNVITISKAQADLFQEIIGRAKKLHTPGDPIVITILYSILKYVLDLDKRIIRTLEQEAMLLEGVPIRERPSSFLETTFHLRKEANQLVPSLLHLREIISVIASKRVPLEGFSEKHEKIFAVLSDEATYLHEMASNARDNLQSLVDLYINTTSYETNKVMRIIAVITCLGILPAVMGLLGSNIAGNPWNIQLWQVFSILGVLMLAMAWIFYRMGWLKG